MSDEIIYNHSGSVGEDQIYFSEIFMKAVLDNNLEIAKWLFSIQKVNIDDYMFFHITYKCNLEMVQWIYSLQSDFEIKTGIEASDDIEVVKWLYSKNTEADLEDALFMKCEDDKNLPILQWFYEVKPAITEYFCSIFRSAYRRDCNLICRWIYSIQPDIITDHMFIEICETRNLDAVHFFNELHPDRFQFTENDDGSITSNIHDLDINTLQTKTIKLVKTCLVCFDVPSTIVTNCNHQYCTDCINKWIKRSHSCAYCRNSLVPKCDLFRIHME
jgi:hypothetical protein